MAGSLSRCRNKYPFPVCVDGCIFMKSFVKISKIDMPKISAKNRNYFSSFSFLCVDARHKNAAPKQRCVTDIYFVSLVNKLITALIKKQIEATK